MKRIPFAFLMIVVLIGAACSFGIPNAVHGSGNIQSKTFDVRGFDQVALATVGEVLIEQGDSESLTIETDDNILPLLEVKVADGRLTLSSKDNVTLDPSVGITYRLSVKLLNTIIADSSGDLAAGPVVGERLDVLVNASGEVTLDGVQVKDFTVRSSGSGDVTLKSVKTEQLQARLSASGNVEIAGSTAALKVEVNGSGSLRAGDLQAAEAEVDLQASGSVTVWAADALDVTLSGSGDLDYYGSPRMTSNLGGSGALRSLGEK